MAWRVNWVWPRRSRGRSFIPTRVPMPECRRWHKPLHLQLRCNSVGHHQRGRMNFSSERFAGQAPAVRTLRPRTTAPRALPLRLARFWIVCLFFLVWACAIAGRLFWLQIVRHQEYLDRAQKQQQRTFEVAPRRGVLYDRNLRELAMTVQVDSIYAVPTEIENKSSLAQTLAAIVHTDPDDAQTSEEQIAARLIGGHGFAWVARRVTPEASAKIKALNLKGIYFQKEFQRVYPDNQIAAQVLGYVGTDDTGLGGLEQKFEPQLHGVPG